MKRARVTTVQMEAFPEGAVWNAFVELLAMSEAEELGQEQLPAQYAFWYDSEVQNGGHLQYFLNRGISEARNAIGELRRLGAVKFGGLLERAVSAWDEQQRKPPTTSSEYVELALGNEFGQFDAEYYAMSPALIEILEANLSENQDQYVLIE